MSKTILWCVTGADFSKDLAKMASIFASEPESASGKTGNEDDTVKYWQNY